MRNVLAEGVGLGDEVCWIFPVGGSVVYGDLSWSFEGRLSPGYIGDTCGKNCFLEYRESKNIL